MGIKQARDGLVVRMPVISLIVKKINIARAVRFMAGSTEVIPANSYYREAVMGAMGKMKRGEKLSQALKNYPDLFPLMVVQMIEVGEETGGMPRILDKLGDFFEAEAADALKELMIIIKLALMIILGAAVGFFLILSLSLI